MKLANEIGSKIFKEVNITISHPINSISITHKICSKCNQIFTYGRSDDEEKFFRKFASLKKGNLNLCFTCDELDKKYLKKN